MGTDTKPKIGALAPWFGGKRTLAPAIVVELGKHTQYFEPFCGSIAVLLAKTPSQKETVNDLHGDLINLARIIADPEAAPRLYDRLQRATVCEGLLEQAREELADRSLIPSDDLTSKLVDRAYWYFLASWQARNGTAGAKRVDYQIAVRWTKSGGSPTVRWRNVVESLPAWHRRLQNVVILCRDAFRIIDRFEDVKETAIYVDPPYVADSRSGYRKGAGSDHKYLHEFDHGAGGHETDTLFAMQKKDQHEQLRDVLAAYKHARVVVSYYDCERVRELYEGWTFVEHTQHKNLHTMATKGSGKRLAPEVLILNGPSYARAETAETKREPAKLF